MAQVEFTSAVSGTGKTLRRGPHFLVNEWLPDFAGIHYSNFPLYPDKIVEYAKLKFPSQYRKAQEKAEFYETQRRKIFDIGEDLTDSDFVPRRWEDRIHIISDAEMQRWRRRESGPWDYFADKDLTGGHIALDEIHNFVFTPSNAEDKAWVHKWTEWLGELRHRGLLSFEAISQDEIKVATAIRRESALDREIVSRGDEYNYFTGILCSDWWQVDAVWRGCAPEPWALEVERIKRFKKWVVKRQIRYRLSSEYFALYNSYSKPVAGGKAGSTAGHPYQNYGRIGILLWCLRRNFAGISLRVAGVAIFIWLLAFGGGMRVIEGVNWLLINFMPGGATANASVSDPAPSSLPVQNDTGVAQVAAVPVPKREKLVGIGKGYAIFSGWPPVKVGAAVPWDAGLRLVRTDAFDRVAELSDGQLFWLGK